MKITNADLTQRFRDFIRFYGLIEFGCTNQTDETIVKKMHGGDCGVAAIAVALSFGAENLEQFCFYDNGFHGYLAHGGLFYDSALPDGTTAQTDLLGSVAVNAITFDEFVEAFCPCDWMGLSIVEGFIGLYHSAGLPKALKDTVDDNYEDSDWCAQTTNLIETAIQECQRLS